MRRFNHGPQGKILSIHQVANRLRMTSDEILKLVRQGRFPKSTMISEKLSGWPEDDVHDWALGKLRQKKKR